MPCHCFLAFWKNVSTITKNEQSTKIPAFGLSTMQVQLAGCEPMVGAFFIPIRIFLGKLSLANERNT